MTIKSDLKKRVRARQAKTGESYTTARAHILRARDGGHQDDTTHDNRITYAVPLRFVVTPMRTILRTSHVKELAANAIITSTSLSLDQQ